MLGFRRGGYRYCPKCKDKKLPDRLLCDDTVTMFNIVNTYTRAAQFKDLPAETSYRRQKVGGNILGMLKQR